MQTASAAFGTAVTSSDQMIAYKVLLSLPNAVSATPTYSDFTDNLVQIQSFYRQINTTTPQTTTLITGYPSVQPVLTFAGPLNLGDGIAPDMTKTVYWLFNPFDPTSPMFRQARTGIGITIQLGLYDGISTPELLTVFTGTIDTIECDIDGTVTMSCVDQRSTVTSQATLPPVITQAPFNAGLDSEYAIDYLFRHASPKAYYSWPAQRANCVLAVGFRSSLWPELGSYAFYAQVPSFGEGLYGSALTNASSLNAYTTSAPIAPTQSYFVEAFVTGGSGSNFQININDAAVTYEIIFEWTGGSIIVAAVSPGGTAGGTGITIPNGSHYVSLLATWPAGSATAACIVTIDGVTHSFNTSAINTRPSNLNFTICAIGCGSSGTIEGVQVTTESAPLSNASFAPTLILDPAGSLNTLTAMPDITGQDTWAVLQDIANAEAGVIGFNELGKAFFTNRETIQNAAVARTVTSTSSLMTLATLEQQSLVATHVQIPVNQLQITGLEIVWSSSSVIAVSANSTFTFNVQTETPVVNIDPGDHGYYFGTLVPGKSYWQACTTADGTTGNAVGTGISIQTVQLAPALLQISVTNSNPFILYLVTPTGYTSPTGGGVGSAALFIGGQAAAAVQNTSSGSLIGGSAIADAQWPPLRADGTGGAVSNTTYGEVLLAISSNAWIQDLPTAQLLANWYLEDLAAPKPMVQNISMVPDARLQNLDRVTLVDSDVSGISADVLVIGINMSLQYGTFSQALDARFFYRPGSWILGVQGSSELNLTTWTY